MAYQSGEAAIWKASEAVNSVTRYATHNRSLTRFSRGAFNLSSVAVTSNLRGNKSCFSLDKLLTIAHLIISITNKLANFQAVF